MNIKCRACLGSSTRNNYFHLSNSFQEPSNLNLTVLDILEFVVSFKVYFTDNLPQYLCADCLNSLKDAYNFITLCTNSESLLKLNISNTQLGLIKTNEHSISTESSIVNDNESHRKKNMGNVNCEIEEEATSNNEEGNNDVSLNNSNSASENIIMVSIEDVLKEESKTKIEEIILKEESVFDNLEYTSKIQIMTVEDVLGGNKKSHKKKIQKKNTDGNIFSEIYPCTVCKKLFSTKKNMQGHRSKSHYNSSLNRVFKCSICEFVARSKSALQHHKMKHKGPVHFCEVCGKGYLESSKLRVHIKAIHANKREHLCQLCGKGFNYPNALMYHMKLHTGEKNYVCKFCGLKFRMAQSVKRHERTHTGEKPYKCQYCDISFASHGQCKEHEYGHTGYNPYPCKYCEKGFKKMFNLRVHLMGHGGSFLCNMCDRDFCEADTLKFHYKYHHKIKEMLVSDNDNDE